MFAFDLSSVGIRKTRNRACELTVNNILVGPAISPALPRPAVEIATRRAARHVAG